MGRKIAFQAGEKNEFALKITFQEDPHQGASIDQDLAHSWGGFQLWADGKNLCAHSEEGEIVDSVYWYLLPFLEWITANWDAMLHEERLPNQNKGDNAWLSLEATCFPPFAVEQNEAQANRWEDAWSKWWQRHCIRTGREGGIFPDVIIRRWRDEIEISWGVSRLSGMPEHYQFQSGAGVYRVAPEIAARTLFNVLDPVVDYLKSLNPNSNRLISLDGDISRLLVRKRNDRLMWLAGFGTDQDSIAKGWQRIKDQIANFKKDACEILFAPEDEELVVTGSCHAALMFGTVSPEITDSDVMILAQQLIELSDPSGDPEKLRPHVRHTPVEPLDYAWEQGYHLAEEFLKEMDLPGSEDLFVDVERLLDHMGICSGTISLSDASIRGISIAGTNHRPGILLSNVHDANQFPSGRRFTVAHELCHILFDRKLGRPLALASGPWAPRDIERRANAFAAMLLMPTRIVESAIRRLALPLESLDAVAGLAKSFKTSVDATLQHLCNLGYIDESLKDRVSREASRKTSLQEESQ